MATLIRYVKLDSELILAEMPYDIVAEVVKASPQWVGNIVIMVPDEQEKAEGRKVRVCTVGREGGLKKTQGRDYLLLSTRSDLASVFNSVTSERKAQACRVNGMRGGRPKKLKSDKVQEEAVDTT
jgi:hypothetical protein